VEVCEQGEQRDEHQSSVFHLHIPLGDLMLVAAGVRGSPGGAIAANIAVERFYNQISGRPQGYPAEKAIHEAAASANSTIVTAANSPGSLYESMHATMVMALLQREGELITALIGHIGNCRAYLLRADRLKQITADHSTVQALLNRGLITAEEALNHPDAMIPDRCLGLQPNVEIEIDQIPLAVGDTLLLCSDGLWGFVHELDIEALAREATPEESAHSLLELAVSVPGHSNVGIEMARVLSPPDPDDSHKENSTILTWIVVAFAAAIISIVLLACVALLR